jgi:DNA-binding Lrp family transcriptional regulator
VPSIPTSYIAQEISKIEEVESLFEVAGPYDITITISGVDITSINEIIEKIRSLDGIQQTTTLFVLKEW